MRSPKLLASLTAGVMAATAAVTAVAASPAVAVSAPGNIADHTLAGVPTMIIRPGTWKHTNDTLMRQDADAAVSSGLAAKGWNIIAVDDDWMIQDNGKDWDGTQIVPASQHGRDLNGNFITSPSKYPNGIKSTIDYVHSKGLRFGIYIDGGTYTCDGAAGSWGHFTQDANYFASMGVDYIKMDYCNAYQKTSPGLLLETQHDADTAVTANKGAADAIAAANKTYGTRMILNSVVPTYFNSDDNHTSSTYYKQAVAGSALSAQAWRVSADTNGGTWETMKTTLAQGVATASFARAGHFNDFDQLAIGKTSMTQTQQQAQFSAWAVMASPLNVNLEGTAAFTPERVADAGNTDVIAVDQDRLGVQGKQISTDANTDVYSKPLANGDYAVLLLNKSTTAQTISTTAAAIGTSSTDFTLKDLWSKQTTSSTGAISATVPATSAVLYRLHPNQSGHFSTWRTALNATVISDDDAPTAGCFDRVCDSFSSDALAAGGAVAGGHVSVNGQTFDWLNNGSGRFDSITATGQTIDYFGSGTTLGFLGASSGGDTSGTITLNYSDGTSSTATLGFPNWQTSNPTAFGDSTAVTALHRNTPTGPDRYDTNWLVSYAPIAITAGKSLTSITLPNTSALHIFSITKS
ncbi:glycoside hydrolase family 27 protein [Kitasatospora sp. NBC_00240]|uniref:glycoside hydrolase family 27 protein n=1 Tax=Kitasatospora sp. NBC_00240 TaxID=2903567 RepID=UPI00224F121E|nr:glycoside hydrolase family 27 protein [Kitasatospora sp. NBC_00240]MCX5208455.1 glycoside hydrolase family 27 protein [Kitasatospora sp. NBC_00240]